MWAVKKTTKFDRLNHSINSDTEGDAMDKKTTPRWLVLAACAICGGMTGVCYVWSIFKAPLMEVTGIASTTATFAYSLFLICVFISNALTAQVVKHINPKKLVGIAGIGFGLSYVLTGFATNTFTLYLFFSVLGGISDGFIYNLTVSVALRWYPDRKGFANGVCIGAMGLAPVIFAPLGNWLIQNYSVKISFIVCGVILLVLRFIFGMFVKDPPEGYMADYIPEGGMTLASKRETPTRKLFGKPLYWVLFIIMITAGTSGQMITGQAASIGADTCGLTPAQTASLVAILAIANTAGRFGFGWISDRIGRIPALIISLAITTIDMLVISNFLTSYGMFILFVCLAGIPFGALMALMPAFVSDVFGAKSFSGNWPFIYVGYTIAGFIGPMLSAWMYELRGSYSVAFTFAGIVPILGIVLLLAAAKLLKKEDEKLMAESHAS